MTYKTCNPLMIFGLIFATSSFADEAGTMGRKCHEDENHQLYDTQTCLAFRYGMSFQNRLQTLEDRKQIFAGGAQVTVFGKDSGDVQVYSLPNIDYFNLALPEGEVSLQEYLATRPTVPSGLAIAAESQGTVIMILPNLPPALDLGNSLMAQTDGSPNLQFVPLGPDVLR